MKLTTAFEARRRLVELLAARPALDGVKVTRGGPTDEADIAREMIYLTSLFDEHDAEYAVLGAQRRDEDYTLLVNVYVFKVGDDEAATEARCEALCDEVTTAVHEDMTLGALLKQAAELSLRDQRTDPVGSPKGWRSTATIALHCQALIRP